MEKEENVKRQPLVSICLITYNHEKYIQQAVDTILERHMDFSYELLIADDASTDQTQQILREKYKNVEYIRLILRKKNSEGKNIYLVFQQAKGKYIYYCEGDDYWIGRDGLQTLVDWLEKHEKYIGVCGRRVTLSEKTGLMSISYDKKTDNCEIQLNDFLNSKATFDCCALLFKNFYQDKKYDYRHYLACRRVGDLTLMTYVLLHGKVFQIDKLVGVYRSDRVKGAGSYNEITTPRRMFEDHIEIIEYLPNLIHEKLDYYKLVKRYAMWYVNSFVSTYELLKQIPYIQSKVGIRMTLGCIKDRIKAIRC